MSDGFFLGITSGYDGNGGEYKIYAGVEDKFMGFALPAILTTATVLAELFKQIGDPKHPLVSDKKAMAVGAVKAGCGISDAITDPEDGSYSIGDGANDIAIDITDLNHIRIFGCNFAEAFDDDGADGSSPDEVFESIPGDVNYDDNPMTPYEFAVLYSHAYPHIGGDKINLSALKKYGHWDPNGEEDDND